VTRLLARRRRRERVAGVVLAALGGAVLIIALIALRSPNGHGTVAGDATSTPKSSSKAPSKSPPKKTSTSSGAARPTTSPTTTPTTSPTATSGKLPLVILNNTTVAGLAKQAATRFEQGGWTVTSYGNYQNDILSTCAYYDPADPGAEAAARAIQAQFPTIKRVAPRFAQLPAGPIVVVLTPDYVSG
jgi:LytR cell envelope-related transcriptional attenuator